MYNRDSKIMRKLLGKVAPETPTGDPNNSSITSAPASSVTATYRPSKPRNGVYKAGVPILSLDVAPDRRAAVLGGAHILKTLVLDDPQSSNFNFHEGVDLRAVITAQTSGPKGGSIADQLSIRDVKWHGSSTIFTACANGKIFTYDVTRVGSGAAEPLEYIQMQEDSRQINTLDVNPHLKSWLLSGSQDGMARVFDTSAPLQSRSAGITFRQRFAPLKCIDSVRQVKWSPKVGHEMACCTEGGVVLKWDVRQPSRPLLRINAHEKACASIAWHPDGTHLISGGWDTKLHVWDLGATADKRQKPKYTVSTPAPIFTIAWRPGLWSATAQSKRVAQVAVAYDDSSSRRYGTSAVHIWDLARPTMPYKEIERFDSSPGSLLWQSQDMLWTVGPDGLFTQCDVAFAPKVIDRQSTSSMAFSPQGDVLMFLDERPHSQRPRPTVNHHSDNIPRTPYSSSPTMPILSISRSDSEEDIVGSFLGPRRRQSRKRTGGRPGQQMSTTPPSGSSIADDQKLSLGLEQTMKVTGIFKSQQTMASGRLPASRTTQVYQYLSTVYLETLQNELPCIQGGKPLSKRVSLIMEQYAKAAESVSLFRLSQTWRVLAYAVDLLLERRAQYHLEIRTGRFQKVKVDDKKGSARLKPVDIYSSTKGYGDQTPRRSSAQSGATIGRSMSSRSLLSEELETTSNQPTPLARPADASRNGYGEQSTPVGKRLTAVMEPDELDLGPAVQHPLGETPRKRLDSVPVSEVSHDSELSHISSTEGYDFYDAEALSLAMDVPIPKQKEPLTLDYPGSRNADVHKVVVRHDSDESFPQMFSPSDATKNGPSTPAHSGNGPWKSSLARHASDMSQEFQSRIRGEKIQTAETPEQPKRRKSSNTPESPEDLFLISQTTMGTDDMEPSQSSQLSDPSQFEAETAAEANGQLPTSSLQHQPIIVAPASQPSRSPSPLKEPFPAQQDARPYILETDYLPWNEDAPYPQPLAADGPTPAMSPLDPYSLITKALDYESRTSALNASAIILLLKPLVPDSVIDYHQASAVLRQHHSRLMRMSLFIEASLLRNVCVQGWPEGLPEWGENYTAIFSPSQQGVKVGFFCASCRKPREIDPKDGDGAIWTCQRCRTGVAPCAICGHRDPAQATHVPVDIAEAIDAPDAWLSEWWYCPGCTHGGHASCLQAWHAPLATPDPSSGSSTFSDGCCPLDGCGHACLPGKYRGEITTARADELGRAAVEKSRSREDRAASVTGSSSRRSSPRPGVDRQVKSDSNDIPQSRAVGMAREVLKVSAAGAAGGGILSSSPGRQGVERERRKSVKFAGPDR
ncbi:hypothetical protein BGZ63DRAFT_390311 [Mariannaea sp. PMI_226]|nr:hypothetical protein BGZ63DRAFT_390311 [Mariannaea sp. PMI_226]